MKIYPQTHKDKGYLLHPRLGAAAVKDILNLLPVCLLFIFGSFFCLVPHLHGTRSSVSLEFWSVGQKWLAGDGVNQLSSSDSGGDELWANADQAAQSEAQPSIEPQARNAKKENFFD